jgi:hypothetical protein
VPPSAGVDGTRGTATTPAPAGPAITGRGQVVGLGGRCLDVVNGATRNGTGVQIFRCNGSPAQTWSVYEDGTLRVLKKCLQVVNKADPRLQISTCNGRRVQQWVVNSGVIVNLASAECLDVQGSSPRSRTPVITAGCGGGSGQSWALVDQ